jgi:hypothetical protein
MMQFDYFPEENWISLYNTDNGSFLIGGGDGWSNYYLPPEGDGPYAGYAMGETVIETVDIAPGNWIFTVIDTFGDGMCCSEDPGDEACTDSPDCPGSFSLYMEGDLMYSCQGGCANGWGWKWFVFTLHENGTVSFDGGNGNGEYCTSHGQCNDGFYCDGYTDSGCDNHNGGGICGCWPCTEQWPCGCDDACGDMYDGEFTFPNDCDLTTCSDGTGCVWCDCEDCNGGECTGHCGGQATSGCWCDEACVGFCDCCDGAWNDCPDVDVCDCC